MSAQSIHSPLPFLLDTQSGAVDVREAITQPIIKPSAREGLKTAHFRGHFARCSRVPAINLRESQWRIESQDFSTGISCQCVARRLCPDVFALTFSSLPVSVFRLLAETRFPFSYPTESSPIPQPPSSPKLGLTVPYVNGGRKLWRGHGCDGAVGGAKKLHPTCNPNGNFGIL